MYRCRWRVMLVLVAMCSHILHVHANRCGRYQLQNLSCDEAIARYDTEHCSSYDLEDDINATLQALRPDSELLNIMAMIKCKVYVNKKELCQLNTEIKTMVTTNCVNPGRRTGR
ncbi:uncharacterized protein [Argopecten irradians]|uniref:uncharacterized protein n=1 Tax=Argopecten irradians TaxID=31199 RepID=UPI003718F450